MVVFFSAINNSLAQSYTITPNDTIQITGLMEDLETLTISQLNTSNDTIRFQWRKVSEFVPANWDASVCDNFICHTTLMDSGITNPVAPAETGFLLLHITAHVNFGTAIIRYAIWDIKNPSFKDTLTFILKVNANTGISELEKLNIVCLYPNPAINNITISSTFDTGFLYTIADISGKEIIAGISESKVKTILIENVQNGIYFVSVFDKNQIKDIKRIMINN